jgi:hydrogenase expression/formation protein HypD
VEKLEPFRDKKNVKAVTAKINRLYPGGSRKLMEVCGTHTMAIARYGLRELMPDGLKLISGPGCPVCVTPTSIINAAVKISEIPGNVIVTFGDMLRVPGTEKSLEVCKAEGADVRVLYSVFDMLAMAQKQKDKNFVFISVGFETTTPGIALSVLEAEKRKLSNVFYLVANRLVIPAMDALCSSGEAKIDGFICPGHVSVLIGYGAYNVIADRYGLPCVVAGFEPVDILLAISELIERISKKSGGVANSYRRVVTEKGNVNAMNTMDKVFQPVTAEWRGIGSIPESGLALRNEFIRFDAMEKFQIEPLSSPDPKGCRCGDVLKGVMIPPECGLFGKRCKPESPVGPCMVSSEGSCAAYYKYGVHDL